MTISKARKVSAVLLVLGALLGCSPTPQSSFELASDSRLPVWFTIPEGSFRTSVTARLEYFKYGDRETVVLTEFDFAHHVIAKVKGEVVSKNILPNMPVIYPLVVTIRADNKTDTVVHMRAEPVFHMR